MFQSWTHEKDSNLMGNAVQTALVCLNGHVVTDFRLLSSYEAGNYSPRRRAVTIAACPNCSADIP